MYYCRGGSGGVLVSKSNFIHDARCVMYDAQTGFGMVSAYIQ